MKELGLDKKYSTLRVVIVRENWLGCTGLSAFDAFLRLGVSVSSLSESEYVPLQWHGFAMRILSKVQRRWAVDEFNRALTQEATWRNPDILLVFKGQFVKAKTVRTVKALGVVTYCFYPDVSFTAYGRGFTAALREYDWIFTTKSFGVRDLTERLGITQASFLPHAFDVRVHRPRVPTARDRHKYECGVAFIGTWSPKKERFLTELIKARPDLDLKVWGNQWEKLQPRSLLERCVRFEPVTGIDYATALSCSKINVGLLLEQVAGASSGDRITSRTFHIPAAGGVMLHERTEDLARFFVEDRDCACFADSQELVIQIDRLLKDAELRRRLSENGRNVVESAHSWDHRARQILDHYLLAMYQRGADIPTSATRTHKL